MEIREIKSILDLMNKHGLAEFELERKDFKIRIKRGPDGQPVVHAAPIAAAPAPVALPATPAAAAPTAAPAAAAPAESETAASDGNVKIEAPIVGTFYTSPSPDSEVYVKVGDQVSEDTVVCIIEAMKVMNEIKAETSGTILEILAQNGKPVEFGKPLFLVKPS